MYAKAYKKKLLWRVGLFGLNHELIMNSETYYSKSNARRVERDLNMQLIRFKAFRGKNG